MLEFSSAVLPIAFTVSNDSFLENSHFPAQENSLDDSTLGHKG